jgi:hypothetical protein
MGVDGHSAEDRMTGAVADLVTTAHKFLDQPARRALEQISLITRPGVAMVSSPNRAPNQLHQSEHLFAETEVGGYSIVEEVRSVIDYPRKPALARVDQAETEQLGDPAHSGDFAPRPTGGRT